MLDVTSRTEEFRQLNSNLQNYLNDIQRIDDDNRQLQETIEQIRTDHVRTLETHLQGLPNDFRRESGVLTQAHLERYRSKSRAKRFLHEREELKKRIHFLANNEKEQIKRINQLQKQERQVENECRILNEQMVNLSQYVETERHVHQQAMTRVDELQVQLEDICIQRSKTEFEIQTLREEVKLMQTAKEFLDDEYQSFSPLKPKRMNIFSRLTDSIARIRDDFRALHETQLKQIENEYEQMLIIVEEKTYASTNEQHVRQMNYDKLQDEHQSINEELNALNEHNQILFERIVRMEADLYAIRDERMRELREKDKEFECSEMELQILKSKLNHLAEYDRNLKFELTLYRGVLESEYRRKEQLQQPPIRPSTLRTITINRSTRDSTKNFISRNQFEPVIENSDVQLNGVDRREDNPPAKEEPTEIEGITSPPVSTLPEDQLAPAMSPANEETSVISSDLPVDLSNSLDNHQQALEDENVRHSITDPTLSEDQPESPDTRQSSNIPTEIPNLSDSTLANAEEWLSSAPSSEDLQTPSETQALISPAADSSTTPAVIEDQQAVIDEQALSSLPPSINEEMPSETEQSASDIPQSADISPDEQQIPLESSDLQGRSPTPTQTEPSPINDDDVQERPLFAPTEDVENHLAEGSDGYDNVHDDETAKNPAQSSEFSNVETTEPDQTVTEEPISSSDLNQAEEENRIDSTQLIDQESNTRSLTNDSNLLGEDRLISSPKLEEKDFVSNNSSNFEAVVEDLRYVYRTLLADDGLVEITDEFATHLIDRLEFGDNLIRTSFEDFLSKYIVEPVKTENRSKTLDWIEFRDILFPILTARYTKNHLRKLFDLFDTDQTNRLSADKLTELLELLQVNNSNTLAEESGELNIDQFIEMSRKIDEMNAHLLSEEIESQHWYLQHPNDEETTDALSISSEIPIPHSPSKTINAIILLGRIYRRVGADVENRQLDSQKPLLSMKITNELIHNNIHISNEDLHSFIELYLKQRQVSDSLINWSEFRDVFLPLVNGGMVSKDDITRWFEILDANHDQTLSSEQLLHLLRLLQVSNTEEILEQIHTILPADTTHFTLAELLFALENLQQTTSHLLLSSEQITSFDVNWLKKNVL